MGWMDETFPEAKYSEAFHENDVTEWEVILEAVQDDETAMDLIADKTHRDKIVTKIRRIDSVRHDFAL